MECSIGITTGDIFCGRVGNDRRCEYTTVGAEVNLAARLMTKAGVGGILCDERTQRESLSTIDGPSSRKTASRSVQRTLLNAIGEIVPRYHCAKRT